MGPVGTGSNAVSSAELQKQLQLISQARRKSASVSVGKLKGRLVVRVIPRWNLLGRAYFWLQARKTNKQYRAQMLGVLQDKAVDLSLKKQVYEGIASGVIPGFSQSESARFRSKKASFYRRASISGVEDVTRLLAGGSRSESLQGGAFFVGSGQEKKGLVEHYRRSNGKGEVALVRKPADLDKDDLSRAVHCTSGGTLDTSAGRLFCDEPLTVVLDFTGMTPAQIASLNELFDTPPRFQGRTLGAGVTLVGLVSRKMLANHPDNPGPDFWRRMDSLGFCLLPGGMPADLADDTGLLKSMEGDDYVTAPQTPQSSQAIDFYKTTGHWKTLIFGGFQLSGQGKLHFQDGALAKLDRASGYVELVNPPMDDPEFVQTMAEAIRNRGFWANGQWTALPDDLSIKTQVTSKDGINHELSQLAPLEPGQSYACINEENIETVLSGISLKQGRLLKNDTLTELLGDAKGVVVSDELPESQWVLLINRLLSLKPKPSLAVAPGCRLPAALNLQPFVKELPPGGAVKMVAETVENGPEVFEYYIDARTQPQSLLCSMPMESQQSMTFVEHYTPLMEALLAGKPVCLHGLEKNPAIAKQLESLLSPAPYLYIAGNRVPVPELKLSCAFPSSHRLTGLWRQLIKPEEVSRSLLIPEGFEELLTPENMSCLRGVMTALKSIPRSNERLYPDMPQKLEIGLLAKIAGQVLRETRSDGSDSTTPYHWRKALNDVLAKEYRGDPLVYGFVKAKINQQFVDDDAPRRVDRSAVGRWLSEQDELSPELIRQHYWLLARYVSPSCLANPKGLTAVTDEALNALMPIVVQCAPESRQQALAEKLGCQTAPSEPVERLDGDCYRRVYGALMAAGPEGRVQSGQPVHRQVLQLTGQLSDRQDNGGDSPVSSLLKNWFVPELLQKDFHDLPEALGSDKHSRYRQLRRVRRLAEVVRSIPLVMLKGKAGAGKSFIVHLVASSDGKEPMVLSLSPEHTQAELFGQEVLKPKTVRIEKKQLELSQNPGVLWRALCSVKNQPGRSSYVDICFDRNTRQRLSEKLPEEDYYELVETFADHYTEFEPGPLYEWAEMADPPVLILDEANLVKEGVLEPLAGLKRNPPELSIHGRVIQFSPKHRVIMTGNPESYDGRLIDPKLRQEALTLYYRPMSDSVLAEVILNPGLPNSWSDDCRLMATERCMQLYQQFRAVLPGHTFGPRDLKDILARLEGYTGSEKPTMAQINSMLWQSVSDCLANEVSPGQQRQLRALNHWFHAHCSCDASLVEARQQGFDQFYRSLKKANGKDKFDFDVPSVKELAFKVWLDLEKDGGKHAVIIEGEAGRGKDALLDRLLPAWRTGRGKSATFDRINASVENWEEIKQLATKAMRDGSVLVISELNTLPSRYLEGFFNEVLNGEAKKGFKLIATINPASYSGREAFSEAMQSRCTLVKINPFTEEELQGLLGRRYRGKQKFTQWLTSEHCRLERKLEKANLSVKLPPVKLMNAAEVLKDVPVEQRQEAFAKEYRLAMMALETDGQATGVGNESDALNKELQFREERLCRVVNSQLSQPVMVTLVSTKEEPSFKSPSGPLVLPDNPDFNALISLAAKTIRPVGVSADEGEGVESDGAGELQQQMQNALEIIEEKEKEDKALEQAAVESKKTPAAAEVDKVSSTSETAAKVPGSWALSLMPVNAIAKLVSKLPLEAALSILGKLPFRHIAKLFSLLPLNKIIGLAARLPFEKLAKIIDHLPLEKMLKMVCNLPFEKFFKLMDYLPIEKIVRIIQYLPLERLLKLFCRLPLERMAGLVKHLPMDRLIKLAESLPMGRLIKVCEQLDLERFAKLADSLPADRLTKIRDDLPHELQKVVDSVEPELKDKVQDQNAMDTESRASSHVDSDPALLEMLKKEINALPVDTVEGALDELERKDLVAEQLSDEALSELFGSVSAGHFLGIVEALSPERLQKVFEKIPSVQLQERVKRFERELLDDFISLLPAGSEPWRMLEVELNERDWPNSGGRSDLFRGFSLMEWLPERGRRSDSVARKRAVTEYQKAKASEELIRFFQGEAWKNFDKLSLKEKGPVYQRISCFSESYLKQLCDRVPVRRLLGICDEIAPEVGAKIIKGLSEGKRVRFVEIAGTGVYERIKPYFPESLLVEHLACGSLGRLEELVNDGGLSSSVKEQLKAVHRRRCLESSVPEAGPVPKICRRTRGFYDKEMLEERPVTRLFLQRWRKESKLTELLLGLAENKNGIVGYFELWTANEMSAFFDEIEQAMLAGDRSEGELELLAFMTSFREGVLIWKDRGRKNRLPEAFPQVYWRLMTGIRSLYQKGVISPVGYGEMVYSALYEEPVLPVELGLEFLEDLKAHPDYGEKASESMMDYYRDRLVSRTDFPDKLIRSRSENASGSGREYKIDFLEKTLGKRVINPEWSQSPGGGAPNIDRLARNEIAVFPVNSAASELPAVIVTMSYSDLRSLITEELRQNPKLNLELSKRGPERRRQIEHKLEIYVRRKFRNALARFVDRANWKVVIPQAMEGGVIPPGLYDGEALIPVFSGGCCPVGFDSIWGYFDYQSHVDYQQIPELQDSPNAIVLDRKKGQEMIRDFIRQIPPEDLYDELFSFEGKIPGG